MNAVISDCGSYRYRLDRDVDPLLGGPVYAFFGVNPSTADANLDDATVRKWRGFVSRWGGSRFIVGNVFAYRATDVRELASCADPVGKENLAYLLMIAAEADIIVPCWGNVAKVPRSVRHQFQITLDAVSGFGKPVCAFGASKSGDPLHPLMLGYDTPLIDWAEAGRAALSDEVTR